MLTATWPAHCFHSGSRVLIGRAPPGVTGPTNTPCHRRASRQRPTGHSTDTFPSAHPGATRAPTASPDTQRTYTNPGRTLPGHRCSRLLQGRERGIADPLCDNPGSTVGPDTHRTPTGHAQASSGHPPDTTAAPPEAAGHPPDRPQMLLRWQPGPSAQQPQVTKIELDRPCES